MPFFRIPLFALACASAPLLGATASLRAQGAPPAGGNQPPATAGAAAEGGIAAARRAPRPYAQVITARARTDRGAVSVHRVDDRFYFEVPDSLAGRDFLMVTRVSGVPAGAGGFLSAGSSLVERLVRFERVNDRVLLRSINTGAVADDTLPIAGSVAQNNYPAIIGAFPVAAYGKDSASYVIDVTDFFGNDNPATSGLGAAQRRSYGVRRYDAARSYIASMRGFPGNIEVRQVQTFDAATPPSDADAATVTMETRQSILLLPKVPMRPRHADARVGYFSVNRVNYGLDVQKAESQTFITRWRLEPKDPAAYARGELVEPVKPIVYYLDPATPTRWKRYVKEGVENWQQVFEKAGFKNAILAREAPSKSEDPDFDMDDARYSVVRWAASLVRNATGPHTHDPRSGEIINSEITWYHNHMRSYRNWLIMETGAANPAARSLDIPEELMGETMRQVITHEIGHALGLQHNMIASASFPVDSLRSPSFTRVYGVSATIMDYARQNYVAQPGDGLQPKDFIRRVGPFDDFAINWGYRVTDAPTPEAERATLNRWLTQQTGLFPYRFASQQLAAGDPRNQTEDLGDDPLKATTYSTANYKRVLPNLATWLTKPGEDFTDLRELYEETVGRWFGNVNHVATVVGGVEVDLKVGEQSGPVYRVVPKARQKAALTFIGNNVFSAPEWLMPASITTRIGPSNVVGTRAAGVVTSLLAPARLGRLAEAERYDAMGAYPLAEYLTDLRRALFNGASPDSHRRALQRVYLQRLEALITPPAAPAGGPGGGFGGGAQRFTPFVTAPNLLQSDLPALARSQLRAVQSEARALATSSPAAVQKAHWADVAERVAAILEAGK
jgi:hypothetical protein